jgi:hypothetical protein
MTDFRKRLLGLCGVAVAFAGLANAQYTCGSASSPSTLIRAEGQTEQTADLTIVCSTSATTGAAVNPGTANITLSVSPALAITSKVLGTSSGTSYTEALAIPTTGGLAAPYGALTTPVQGVVTGTGTMLFSGVVTPSCAALTLCNFEITITNVRINATSVGAGPVSISESALVTQGGDPATVNPTLVPATAVAIVLNGLGTNSLSATSSLSPFLICQTSTNVLATTVKFQENFTSAFKTQGATVSNEVLGAWTASNLNTETGYTNGGNAFPSAGAIGSNVANSATRIKIIFSNVPSVVSLYMPITFSTSAGTTLGSVTMVTSENGTFAMATAATGGPANYAALPIVGGTAAGGGTATAIYEVTAQAQGVTQTDQYAIPVDITVTANTVTAPPIPLVTATVQFAAGTAGNVPDFVAGSSTTPLNGFTFSLCSTTLLFPYVINSGNGVGAISSLDVGSTGFDTGMVVANTSTDNLSSTAGNSVKAQSGTCVFNFYGTNAPAAAVTSPTVASGNVYGVTLSSMAPGFYGYAIVTCNFLYAHGFAYISDNLTFTNGVSMGYLALELSTPRITPENLNN